MNITELVKHLEQVKAEQGDLEVCHMDSINGLIGVDIDSFLIATDVVVNYGWHHDEDHDKVLIL